MAWISAAAPAGRVLAVLTVAVLVLAGAAAALDAARTLAPPTVRSLRIPVTDGPHGTDHMLLDATFYTPPGQGRGARDPARARLRRDPGRGRPRGGATGRAGFAVLTWSARGLGASTGQIALDSPDYEVKDVEQLVSWLAPAAAGAAGPARGPAGGGSPGASYGGAIALLAAAYDHRIDAIVPQSTWYNLATALFPDAAGGSPAAGVFKKQWAGLLFTAGSAGLGASRGHSFRCARGGFRCARGGHAFSAAGTVRPVPARGLRDVPAGGHPGPGHPAGSGAAAALLPGQRGEPDPRPRVADPG